MNALPKIAFTYWAGDRLTYLHIMTLRSVTHLNPDYKCIVYTASSGQSVSTVSYKSKEHVYKSKDTLPFSSLRSIPGIEIVEIDFKEAYGVKDQLFHAFLADLTRIKKLEEHGGIWFDMDVLFLKPFSKDLTSFKGSKSVRTCSYSGTIATGLISALPGSPILGEISKKADEYIVQGQQSNFGSTSDYKDHYQAFGPDLWRSLHHPHLDQKLDRSPHTQAYPTITVYPFMWNVIADYFTKKRQSVKPVTIGVHWYNGAPSAQSFVDTFLQTMDLDTPRFAVEQDLADLRRLGVDTNIPRISDFTTSLAGANLQGANLQNADLKNADLSGANLRNANLQNTDLRFADLRGASLNNANLAGANLTGALLDGAAPPESVRQTLRQSVESFKGISVVIAAHNRKSQLLYTLQTLQKSMHPNFEVIIVDDVSDDDQKVEEFVVASEYDFPIEIVTISAQEKTWVNPCVAYNIGIRYASKEIVMLQNAEVCHVGDVLAFTSENLKSKEWLTFNCYGLNPVATANVVGGGELSFSLVSNLPSRVGGNGVMRKDVHGWLNHHDVHFVAYHYCGAIYREHLLRDLGGGFSDLFVNLVGGDDDHFVKRLIRLKYAFKIPKFTENNPFVVHLFHEKSESVMQYTSQDLERVQNVMFKEFIKWGFAPENDIQKAPKSEIPMSRRVLID